MTLLWPVLASVAASAVPAPRPGHPAAGPTIESGGGVGVSLGRRPEFAFMGHVGLGAVASEHFGILARLGVTVTNPMMLGLVGLEAQWYPTHFLLVAAGGGASGPMAYARGAERHPGIGYYASLRAGWVFAARGRSCIRLVGEAMPVRLPDGYAAATLTLGVEWQRF